MAQRKSRLYAHVYEGSTRSIRLIYVLLIAALLIFLHESASADWQDFKRAQSIDDFSGVIAGSGTYSKPPPYQPNIRLSDQQWLVLQRASITKKGWIMQRREDDNDLRTPSPDQMDDVRESGGWTIEYGGVNPTAETSLLDAESIWGWRVNFANTLDILWGRGMANEHIASVGVNAEKYQFMLFKSFGKLEYEGMYDYYNGAMQPRFSSKPVTKREGMDIKIPYSIDYGENNNYQIRGDVEMATQSKYDDMEQKWIHGQAFALTSSVGRFAMSFRQINKGYDNDLTRTTDYSVNYAIIKRPFGQMSIGYRGMNFTKESNMLPRNGVTWNIMRNVKPVTMTIAYEKHWQGEKTAQTITGSLSATIMGTTLSLRRFENIVAPTISQGMSFTLSRSIGSLTFSSDRSQTLGTQSKNKSLSLSLSPAKALRANMSVTKSTLISEPSSYYTGLYTAPTTKRSTSLNYSVFYRQTSFSASFSQRSKTYTISREIRTRSLFLGNSISIGATIQRISNMDNSKTTGITGNMSINF